MSRGMVRSGYKIGRRMVRGGRGGTVRRRMVKGNTDGGGRMKERNGEERVQDRKQDSEG